MPAITTSDWTNGSLSTEIIPLDQLKALDGSHQGMPIWKSNNPEVFRGDGWLLQHARAGARVSSQFNNLQGTFALYLFHINKSSQTRVIHLLVTNPQTTAVQISGEGSMFSNASFPLLGRGTGLNYKVSSNWLNNTPRIAFGTVQINPGKAHLVDQHTLGSGTMVDGRFELTASDGVFVYAVVTSTGNLIDAINASQGGPASGDIAVPAANKFGREAGICQHSLWKGTTPIEIPATQAHLGLCLNTTNKFNPSLQDQTASYLMHLSDSADRSHGNYGHKYEVTLQLNNPSSTSRNVRVSFASNFIAPQNRPSFTYNGPVRFNGQIKDIFTTPTDPKEELGTLTIGANASKTISIEFYVPGLITAGQQLILESL